jgi:small subunit ribosomal protein S1
MTVKDAAQINNFNIPKAGDVIEGKIFEINKNGLFVDLANFKTGVVLPKELKENPDYFKKVKIGDKIVVKIVELENENGYVEVSLKEAGSERGRQELEKKMETKEIIESKVLKANKGGLILEVNGVQAFMPVSQLSSEHYPRVEGGDAQKILQQLQKLVGQTLKVKIIDLNLKEDRLIVSEKATQKQEIEEIIKKYKIGDVVEGTITGIVDFGAFVKFNNLEGLVHISELAYQLIEDPHDIVKIGEKVQAKIIEIDKDKISLSIKALQKNPWEKVREKYDAGQTIKGKVTKFNPFGAFIQLDKDIHGLAHISEFGTEEKMKQALEIGKKYNFKIISIKPNEYRMALKPIFEK